MMLGRTLLIESVPYGTVFTTVGQRYIDGGVFYVPMDMEQAIEAFVDDLNSSGEVKLTHKPNELVDELIKRHGLVIINKKKSSMSPTKSGLKLEGSGDDYIYQLNGIDGDFTLDQLKAFIARGVIKQNTGIKILNSGDFSQVSDYIQAFKIPFLTPFFPTATLEPSEEDSQITIVAKNPAYVRQATNTIQDYFDVNPDESVRYLQGLKDKGVVRNFNQIEKASKRA
jgi:hypothetical protein